MGLGARSDPCGDPGSPTDARSAAAVIVESRPRSVTGTLWQSAHPCRRGPCLRQGTEFLTHSTADDLCRQLSTDSIAGSVTESAFVYIWASTSSFDPLEGIDAPNSGTLTAVVKDRRCGPRYGARLERHGNKDQLPSGAPR